MRRHTFSDHLAGLAHGTRLLARHRGNLTKTRAALDADREWDRYIARHGLNTTPGATHPGGTEQPPQ